MKVFFVLIVCLLVAGCSSAPKIMRQCDPVPARENLFVCDPIK